MVKEFSEVGAACSEVGARGNEKDNEPAITGALRSPGQTRPPSC